MTTEATLETPTDRVVDAYVHDGEFLTRDPDGHQFYELVDHSAFCLDVGDLVPRAGGLVVVTSVNRKPGGSRTIGFHDAPDLFVSERTVFDVPVFYRPRPGF